MERNEKAARAAGPRARRAGKKPKFWTTVYVGPRGTRKRVLLKSPDGRVFEGTREEVRRAGLLPSERHSLAEGLYINHLAFRDKPDTLREQSAFRRMDAIEHHAYRVKNGDAALPGLERARPISAFRSRSRGWSRSERSRPSSASGVRGNSRTALHFEHTPRKFPL